LFVDHGHHGLGVGVEHADDESIRVHNTDACRHVGDREVGEVRRYQAGCTGSDGGGEDVPIVAIGKLEPIDETFVAADHRVGYGDRHQLPGAAEPICWQVGSSGDEVVEALIQGSFGPESLVEAGDRQADQEIRSRAGYRTFASSTPTSGIVSRGPVHALRRPTP